MTRLFAFVFAISSCCVSSAENPRKIDAAKALPVLIVDASRLPERYQGVWANIELRGKLMTGADVSLFMPGGSPPLSASGDVYFVGFTTFLGDMPGRVLAASVTIHAKGFGNGTINVVRAGHFSKGDREFCVQLWLANDTMMVMDRPEDYSDADVAKHATTLKLSARAEKTFVK